MNRISKLDQSWKFYCEFTGLALPPTWLFFTLMTWLYPFSGWPERGIAKSALFSLAMMAFVFVVSFLTRSVSGTYPLQAPYFVASLVFAQFLSSRTTWSPAQELPGALFFSLAASAIFQVYLLYSIVGYLKRRKSAENPKPLADAEIDGRLA